MKRAVFLDRDNTLIHNDGDLGDPDQVKLMQGTASAVASMRGLGYIVVVVSNQGGVARGKYEEADVDRVNQRIAELLTEQANGAKIERFYYCPYHPEGTVSRYACEHHWRKPAPGMLEQAAEDLGIDLSASWMVGDQLRDIEAGRAAGVRTVLLADQGRALSMLSGSQIRPDFVTRNLIEAARVIAQQIRPDPLAEQELGAGVATDPNQGPPPTGSSKHRATYPAREKLEASRTTATPKRTGRRPFKPWAIQPLDGTDAEAEHAAEAPPDGQQSSPVEVSVAAAPPVRRPAERPEPIRPTRARPADAEHPTQPSPQPQAAPVEPNPAQPTRASAPSQPVDPPASPQHDRLTHAVDQLLRYLKRREAGAEEYSLYKLLALGLGQAAVAFCVIIGVFFGDEAVTTANWLLGAVLGQLIVITLLILHGQRPQ